MAGRGRKPLSRAAAATWLAGQPWFSAWTFAPSYRSHRTLWRQVADAVRVEGFFSAKTGTIDVPVEAIVSDAIAIRDGARR